MSKHSSVIVIGSGFAGLSAASFMAKAGWKVTVIEKNKKPGGRAAMLEENGFRFDMGPSWYWMPDVFERYFSQFGKKVSDYYTLVRLDPSYRIYWENSHTDVPSDWEKLKLLFESIEPGSSQQLEKYMTEAAYKYKVGMQKLVYKPGRSITEFLDADVLKSIFRLDLFTSIKKHISKHFTHPMLRQWMEFPVLFLGALPEHTPALYSLMNYADMKGGTWYPQGGMYRVVDAMYRLALDLGVQFQFNEEVTELPVKNAKTQQLQTTLCRYTADVVISSADYHFTETHLLPKAYRSYSENNWNKKVMAPSCLLYYVGLNKKLKNILHHSLFFDVPFTPHARDIYKQPRWPEAPLFYVNASSVTDTTVAPPGCENLVLLIPVASGLGGDDNALREKYFYQLIRRLEKHCGEPILNSVIYKKSYAVSDFERDYHSYRGNAYGLANTLKQTAVFRPSCKSKKVKNLFYTGQLTVPGPGVPPCLISGEVVANEVIREFGSPAYAQKIKPYSIPNKKIQPVV